MHLKHWLFPITSTYQRIRLSLLHTVKEECDNCNGSGWIKSKDTLITKLENWLKRFKAKNNDKRLIIKMNPDIVRYIKEVRKKLINGFMWENFMFITLEEDYSISTGDFRVYSKKRMGEIIVIQCQIESGLQIAEPVGSFHCC